VDDAIKIKIHADDRSIDDRSIETGC
jgi:hypothetical protein